MDGAGGSRTRGSSKSGGAAATGEEEEEEEEEHALIDCDITAKLAEAKAAARGGGEGGAA
jgi:hypothetical protein